MTVEEQTQPDLPYDHALFVVKRVTCQPPQRQIVGRDTPPVRLPFLAWVPRRRGSSAPAPMPARRRIWTGDGLGLCHLQKPSSERRISDETSPGRQLATLLLLVGAGVARADHTHVLILPNGKCAILAAEGNEKYLILPEVLFSNNPNVDADDAAGGLAGLPLNRRHPCMCWCIWGFLAPMGTSR